MAGPAFSWPQIPQAVEAYAPADEPNTGAKLARTVVTVMPATWQRDLAVFNCIQVQIREVLALDFYPRAAP